MRFAARPGPLRRLLPESIVRRHSLTARVELTFDDGPDPTHTPAILDRLREFGVTATFFVLGTRVAKYPEIVERIVAEGHAVGNHTTTHPAWGLATGVAAVTRELRGCQDAVRGVTGVSPQLVRPPLGRVPPGFLLAARRLSLEVLNWSLDSGDWRCRGADDAEVCAGETVRRLRPGDVVLLHDGPAALAVLGQLLPVLAVPSPSGAVEASRGGAASAIL